MLNIIQPYAKIKKQLSDKHMVMYLEDFQDGQNTDIKTFLETVTSLMIMFYPVFSRRLSFKHSVIYFCMYVNYLSILLIIFNTMREKKK